MVDIQSATAEIRRGIKKRKIERNYRMKILWSALLHRATITRMWPMTNVLSALPNIGNAIYSAPCSNAAKTRNHLKFAGVPQTRHRISAVSGLKFTILWGHVEEVLMFNKFFPIVDTYLSCEDTVRQSCAMVSRWRFFASCIFSEPHAVHFRPPFYAEVW